MRRSPLTRDPRETLVLRLLAEAHGPRYRLDLVESSGGAITLGTLQPTLENLEAEGLLTWRREEPPPGLMGRSRHVYTITTEGRVALDLADGTLLFRHHR